MLEKKNEMQLMFQDSIPYFKIPLSLSCAIRGMVKGQSLQIDHLLDTYRYLISNIANVYGSSKSFLEELNFSQQLHNTQIATVLKRHPRKILLIFCCSLFSRAILQLNRNFRKVWSIRALKEVCIVFCVAFSTTF